MESAAGREVADNGRSVGSVMSTDTPAPRRRRPGALMRLYWPKEAAVEGKWERPPLQRVT
jgi:hypothetical protein